MPRDSASFSDAQKDNLQALNSILQQNSLFESGSASTLDGNAASNRVSKGFKTNFLMAGRKKKKSEGTKSDKVEEAVSELIFIPKEVLQAISELSAELNRTQAEVERNYEMGSDGLLRLRDVPLKDHEMTGSSWGKFVNMDKLRDLQDREKEVALAKSKITRVRDLEEIKIQRRSDWKKQRQQLALETALWTDDARKRLNEIQRNIAARKIQAAWKRSKPQLSLVNGHDNGRPGKDTADEFDSSSGYDSEYDEWNWEEDAFGNRVKVFKHRSPEQMAKRNRRKKEKNAGGNADDKGSGSDVSRMSLDAEGVMVRQVTKGKKKGKGGVVDDDETRGGKSRHLGKSRSHSRKKRFDADGNEVLRESSDESEYEILADGTRQKKMGWKGRKGRRLRSGKGPRPIDPLTGLPREGSEWDSSSGSDNHSSDYESGSESDGQGGRRRVRRPKEGRKGKRHGRHGRRGRRGSYSESDGEGGRRRVTGRRGSYSESDGEGGRRRVRGKGKDRNGRRRSKIMHLGPNGEKIWSSTYDSSDSEDSGSSYSSSEDDGNGGRRRRRRRRKSGYFSSKGGGHKMRGKIPWVKPHFGPTGDDHDKWLFTMHGWQPKEEFFAPVKPIRNGEYSQLNNRGKKKLRHYLEKAEHALKNGDSDTVRGAAMKIVHLLGPRILLPLLAAARHANPAHQAEPLVSVITYKRLSSMSAEYVPDSGGEDEPMSPTPEDEPSPPPPPHPKGPHSFAVPRLCQGIPIFRGESVSTTRLNYQGQVLLKNRMATTRQSRVEPDVYDVLEPNLVRSHKQQAVEHQHRKVSLGAILPPTALSQEQMLQQQHYYQFLMRQQRQRQAEENVLHRLKQDILRHEPASNIVANTGLLDSLSGTPSRSLPVQTLMQEVGALSHHGPPKPNRSYSDLQSATPTSRQNHNPLQPVGFLPALLSQSHDSGMSMLRQGYKRKELSPLKNASYGQEPPPRADGYPAPYRSSGSGSQQRSSDSDRNAKDRKPAGVAQSNLGGLPEQGPPVLGVGSGGMKQGVSKVGAQARRVIRPGALSRSEDVKRVLAEAKSAMADANDAKMTPAEMMMLNEGHVRVPKHPGPQTAVNPLPRKVLQM